MNMMSTVFSDREAVSARAKHDPIFGGRSRDELDFLPAALDVVETPAPPLPRMIALALTALLAAAIGWACLGKIDIVATASGKLVPAGGAKVIQPLETGTVTGIFARDGQFVRKGEPLVGLEAAQALADRDRLRGDLAATRLEVARLQAVALGKPLIDPAGGNPEASRVAGREAEAERAELHEKLATLDRQIAEHKAEIDEANAQMARLESLIPSEEKHLEAYQILDSKGYAPRLQLYDAQEKVDDTRHQLTVQTMKIPELREQIATLEHQRAALAAETMKTELGNLTDASAKAASLEKQLRAADEHLRTRTLLAPVDGTVQEVAIHTIGGVVEPGQTLMRIAPTGASVEVEAKLPNKDIGFVRAGLPVTVKVETFTFTKYGVLHGAVTSVSRDAVSEKAPDGAETLNYLVRVKLVRDAVDVDGRPVRLEPGMAVTAEVITGRRRVIEYVLSPLAKASREAGRER